MSDRSKRESMSIEEATVSAIVEVLERKGLCAKQDLYDIITEFLARIPAPAFLQPPSLSHT